VGATTRHLPVDLPVLPITGPRLPATAANAPVVTALSGCGAIQIGSSLDRPGATYREAVIEGGPGLPHGAASDRYLGIGRGNKHVSRAMVKVGAMRLREGAARRLGRRWQPRPDAAGPVVGRNHRRSRGRGPVAMAAALPCVVAYGTARPAEAGAKPAPTWHVDALGSPVPNLNPRRVIPVGTVSVQHNASDKQRPHNFNVVDGNLYVVWWTGGGWQWTNLYAPPSDFPIVEGVGVVTVQDSPQQMTRPYAYVLTADGHLWSASADSHRWNWQDLGTPPGTLVQDGPGASHRPYAFVLGADGNLWHNWWTGAVFRWDSFGTPQQGAFDRPSSRNRVGVTISRVRANSADHPQAFLLDAQRNLWQLGWNGSSWKWQNHGRPLASGGIHGLGAVSLQSAPGQGYHPRAFVARFDQLYQLAWTGSQFAWSAAGDPGGVYHNPNGAIAVRDTPVTGQRPYVFTTDIAGGPVSGRWTSHAGQWSHAEQAGTNASRDASYGGAVAAKDAPHLPERPYVFYWSFQERNDPAPMQLMVNWLG
jgi:hypothetical protein